MGPVFRAFDPDRDRLVAIKVFRLDLPPERVHQLVAEFERLIGAGLANPAIVAPVAAGIDGVTAYLAQDYVAADSLDIALRNGSVPVADALRVATQLAGALDAASAVNIEHGVMHPRDVLIADDDTRLIGLGIARALERVGVPPQVRRPYSAPERSNGSGAAWDHRADVFALAALVHEMLWGRRVTATGDEAAAALSEIGGADMPRIREVFGRALASDPKDRFDAALDFTGELQSAFVRSVRLQPDHSRLQPDHDHEPRLPLEQPAAEEPLRLFLREEEAPRFVEVEPAAPTEVNADLPPDLPPAVLDTHRPSSPGSILTAEPSRSAISPLAFALVIGAALGFVAGFGVGIWGRSETPDATTREFTEDAIRLKPDPTAAQSTPAQSTAPQSAATAGHPDARKADPTADDRSVRPQPDLQTDAVRKPAAPAPIVGSLLVRSTPPGAQVLVDGREYGRTPITVRSLSRGAHSVRVAREGFATDERQVTITASQRAHSVTVRLAPARPPAATGAAKANAATKATPSTKPPAPSAAPLTVESRPSGAQVFIDGQLVGTTPLVVPEVKVGEHAIHLDRDGYRRWAAAIRIVTTERNRVAASLDR